MAPRTIAVIGGLVTDLMTITDRMPDSGETITSNHFSTHPGGKGANSAVAAFRTSHNKPNDALTLADANGLSDDDIQVRMIGAVGGDEFGEPLIKTLERNNVDVTGIRTKPGLATGVCVIIIESDYGLNRILFNPGAIYSLMPDDFLTLESLAGGITPDLLISQLELRRETVEQILETASNAGIDILLNPAPAKYLLNPVYKMVTHLIVNETEAATLTGRQSEELDDPASWPIITDEFLQKGVKNVVVTLGAKGAYYSNVVRGGGYVEAEKELDVVDTTGAGDTFVGAYAVEFVKQKHLGQWDIRRAVQFACKASARTIEQIGAQESIPWADEVEPVQAVREQIAREAMERCAKSI